MPRDYYEVLGVGRDADEAAVKKAFRRLARELHPDVNAHDPDAEAKFKEAAEAYEVLSDPDRRQLYDSYGHEGLKTGGYQPNFGDFGSISDLFSAFFGAGGFDAAFGGGRTRGGPVQGGDVAVAVGDRARRAPRTARTVEVAYDARTRCTTCNGNGAKPGHADRDVRALPGRRPAPGRLAHGVRPARAQRRSATSAAATAGRRATRARRAAATAWWSTSGASRSRSRPASPTASGSASPAAATRASAAARTATSTSSCGCARTSASCATASDLVTVIDVAAPLAALGTTVDVPTLDGPIPVEIKAGTQPGEEIRLGGRGMPPLQRGRTGDLRVVVNVTIPRRLTREQRDMLERFAGTLTDDNQRADEGMIAKLKRVLAG